MKSNHLTRATRRELGLSLIELMVSITIGLILMIAISSAYMGSSSAGKLAEAQGRMNEDAAAALSILAQQIRMAGDNPRRPMYAATTPHNAVFSPLGALTYAVRGCDGKFSDITTAATINDLTCAAGDNTNPDSVAIVYEADPYNTVAASGLATDCLGQTLPVVTNSAGSATPTLVFSGTTTVATAVTYTVADNRFYIQDDGTIPSLYCKGNGNATPQPMVENIEDMQFSWGMAAPLPATDMTVAGYLASANLVETNASLLAMPATDSALRWSRAAAVKICVLVRSEQPVVSDAASAKYSPCFADPANPLVDAPDLRLRRAYYSVVALRNRIQQ